MRTRRPMLVIASLLIASSCALLTRAYRPPLAPKSVAAKVKFPWGWPRERVTLTGVWLRAVTMAMDDFLPAEEAERARAEDAEAVCLARRDSYDAEAYVWAPEEAKDAGDARDGGEPEPDGGSNSEAMLVLTMQLPNRGCRKLLPSSTCRFS